MKKALKLYLVTDQPLSLGRPIEEIVIEAVAGGVTMVQLREKEAPTGEFVALAKSLKALLAPLGVPLIINDRVDVALAADADGVHIGQSDMPVAEARALIGPEMILGLTVANDAEMDAVDATLVDLCAEYNVNPAEFVSMGRSTPFDGMRLRGEVLMTIADGGIVYEK